MLGDERVGASLCGVFFSSYRVEVHRSDLVRWKRERDGRSLHVGVSCCVHLDVDYYGSVIHAAETVASSAYDGG